jgi:hypothetical protein
MQNWMSSWWKMKKEMNWKEAKSTKEMNKKQRVEKNWEEKRKNEERK